MSDIVDRLRAELGREAVICGDAVHQRAGGYWDASPLQAQAILCPSDTAQVSAALRVCHDAGQPVIVHGGLTGCVDGARAAAEHIVLSTERMTAIEELDVVGRTATVQAGVTLQTLQEHAADHGMMFPLDLGARGSCTLGGNLATNAGGINVIRYGMAREQVLGLEAVLADGTVISSMNRMLKNNAGFDLKQLFIGTEGALGIITRAVFRLRNAPQSRHCAMVAMDSFEQVQQLLGHLYHALGGDLCAYEVMWGDHYRVVTEAGWHRPPLSRDHAYYVMLEAEGADPARDGPRFLNCLEEATRQALVTDAVLPQSESERRALWAVREEFDAALEARPVFLYDVSLPIAAMDEYIRDVRARLKRRWPQSRCYVLGHIGDGNLHLFVQPHADGEDLHAASDADVYEPLRPFGGSISAEHGIGREKRGHLGISRSAAEIELMRTLKASLDPHNILNPGVVIDPLDVQSKRAQTP